MNVWHITIFIAHIQTSNCPWLQAQFFTWLYNISKKEQFLAVRNGSLPQKNKKKDFPHEKARKRGERKDKGKKQGGFESSTAVD